MKKIIFQTKSSLIFLSFFIITLTSTPLANTIESEYVNTESAISEPTTNLELTSPESPTPSLQTSFNYKMAYSIAQKAAKIVASMLLLSGGLSLAENFLDLLDEIEEDNPLTKNDLFIFGQRGIATCFVIYKSLKYLYEEIESCNIYA